MYRTCYPPAVDSTPLYYLINGAGFDRTNASASLYSTTPAQIAPATAPGTILVRLVNAGLPNARSVDRRLDHGGGGGGRHDRGRVLS